MKGRLIERFKRLEKMRFALLGWEGMKTRVEYMNQASGGSLEVIQTGYTYIFKMANILRPEDMQKEEDRIRAGLAEGVLILDAKVSLVDVKPHLEAKRAEGVGE